MGQSLAIPRVIPNDWKRLDLIVNKIKMRLGHDSNPEFASLTLSDLVASRLIATDVGKTFESVADLAVWVLGTANQITVTGANGKVTLSTPQDIHIDATPEWAGTVIKNADDDIIFYVDNDEMYFTASVAIPIEAGMSMGLLLALTYAEP